MPPPPPDIRRGRGGLRRLADDSHLRVASSSRTMTYQIGWLEEVRLKLQDRKAQQQERERRQSAG
jgi:hypothetical protein